jgi:hypothetical protein
MLCLIKQDGALVLSWFVGTTLESVALPCADDALMAELQADPRRYRVYGNYQLQGGKYTLLVGAIDAPLRSGYSLRAMSG